MVIQVLQNCHHLNLLSAIMQGFAKCFVLGVLLYWNSELACQSNRAPEIVTCVAPQTIWFEIAQQLPIHTQVNRLLSCTYFRSK